jgi:hypothetical protein
LASKRGLIAPLFIAVQISLLLLLVFFEMPLVAQAAPAAQQSKFSNKAFETVWQRVDQPIFAGKTNRSWFWGPEPLANGLYETYVDSPPYGRRLVQYFDKARMEINDANTNQVTNGLLVVELITGRVQQGDNTYDESASAGADVPIVGDLNNPYPTYHQLARVLDQTNKLQVGDPVTSQWEGSLPSGRSFNKYYDDKATRVAYLQDGFGIPQAFWDFMNRRGVVYSNGRYVDDQVSDWKFSIGLPLTEAYWARVKVGGQDKDVLFQAFERRVLTYTPENDPDFQVEMGNVGLHYIQWRYKGQLPNYDTPLMSVLDDKRETQPQWYQTTEVLNIRTAPDSKAAPVSNSKTRPFVVQLQRGDRVMGLRIVRGEEVEKGDDRWLQIYEKPDLFVYAKYVERMKVPAFPDPPRTNKGLWVAVSINKQMMAVYNGETPIYTTMIASGRPGYDTVKGSFRLMGGYRPLSQTMAGGNRAAGDGYSLEEVRNVTYFYADFAIHGSYWHAKFGLAPQSHGCVNATVYDAGLIHQLPVNTPVEVF